MIDCFMVRPQVLPYLVRRAQENSDVLGRAGYERKLIENALIQRFRTLLFSV